MTDEAFVISLRIAHPSVTQEAIASSLGMSPYIAHSVGTARTTPKGRPLDGIYKETYCSFNLVSKQPGYFIDGIRALLPLIDPHKKYFRELRDTGGRVELYVGVFLEESSGFVFSIEDMSAFVDACVDISVDYHY